VHDAWDALQWLAGEGARTLGLDAARIAVGGDSAGGTLAAVSSIQARDAGLPLALQLLVYPGTTAHQDTPSHAAHADDPMLDRLQIDWFLPSTSTRRSARIGALPAADDDDGVARLAGPGRVRPAGRRRRDVRRPAARGRRAGRPGNLPRRGARLRADGPRAAEARRFHHDAAQALREALKPEIHHD
jgi:acetyl esterase